MKILGDLVPSASMACLEQEQWESALCKHPQFLAWLKELLSRLDCNPTDPDIGEIASWGAMMFCVGKHYKEQNPVKPHNVSTNIVLDIANQLHQN